MDNLRDIQVWSRILVIGVLVGLLGLSALPHRIEREYRAVQQSVKENFPLAAARHLSTLLVYEPWRTDLQTAIGHYAALGGDFKTALVYLGQADTANLLTASDLVLLGDAYEAQDDTDQAVQTWLKALQLEDQPETVFERLLKVHQARKDYVAILADLKNLARLRPDRADYDFQLGLILAAFQPENSLVYLEMAARLDPPAPEKADKLQRSIRTALLAEEPAYTLLEAGRTLASVGEWELAEQAFTQAVQTRPDYAEAWAFLGEARQHLPAGVTRPALPPLLHALSLDPNSVSANSLLALYWQRQGDNDQALLFLQAASHADPHNPYLLAEIGRTYSELGKLPEAQGFYQRAVDLTPQEGTFWSLLAQFLLNHQIQVHEAALPAARQAVLIAPNDAAALDLMGQTLFMLGDFYSARRFLERSLTADPAYALAYLHLGLVELYQDDPAQARRNMLHAMEIAPDATVNSYAKRLLQYYFP